MMNKQDSPATQKAPMHSSSSSSSPSSPSSVPTSCGQQATMNAYHYPVFAQQSMVTPHFPSLQQPSQNTTNADIPTTSFVTTNPWIPAANNATLVSSISSTISNLQLSTQPSNNNHTQRTPSEQEKTEDSEFDEEMGDEVCFLVNNFHVKDSNANFMPYIM